MSRRPVAARTLFHLSPLVVLVVLSGLVLGVPAPARATHDDAAPRLLVATSPTGPFAEQLSGPLMDDLGRVVPVDEATARFWVRNPTSEPALTTVAVVHRGRPNTLTGELTVTLDVDGSVASGRLPPDGDPCELVATGPEVGPGRVQPVRLALAVGDLEAQQGTAEEFALDVDVTMTHVGGALPIGPCRRGRPGATDPRPADPRPADPDCARTVVVTLAGNPSCVPTSVTAGADAFAPRDPAAAVATGFGWLLVGGLLVLAATRRRRTGEHADGS